MRLRTSNSSRILPMKKNLVLILTSEGAALAALRSIKASAAVPIRKLSEWVKRRWKIYKKKKSSGRSKRFCEFAPSNQSSRKAWW